MINFVFEDTRNRRNFLDCPDINSSTIPRFAPSPLVITMINKPNLGKQFEIANKPNKYIIATGVNHHPNDWTGSPLAYNNARKSPFEFLHRKLLKDLQNGKAMVLFDQSFEGYQTTWLWEYFHTECNNYNISPSAIIYVTGNTISNIQYAQWANENNITNRINVIPYAHFEADIDQLSYDTQTNVTVDQQLTYKSANKITTFNCLQKRLRNHRIWFYLKMFEAELIKDGLISMNPFKTDPVWLEGQYITTDRLEKSLSILPLNIYDTPNNLYDDNYYIRRIQPDVCLDSWVSVVSEASFADSETTLFLSEKIFKPIVCMHPFIIVGNRGSLRKLREMGYKTFDGFIDESYDDLPTFERFDAIVESIKKIIAIEDKFSWYKSMRPILEHNRNILSRNTKKVDPSFIALQDCYNKYFNIGKRNA